MFVFTRHASYTSRSRTCQAEALSASLASRLLISCQLRSVATLAGRPTTHQLDGDLVSPLAMYEQNSMAMTNRRVLELRTSRESRVAHIDA